MVPEVELKICSEWGEVAQIMYTHENTHKNDKIINE
jgi:hypothetical protein